MKTAFRPLRIGPGRDVESSPLSPDAIVRHVGNPASASGVLCDKRRALI